MEIVGPLLKERYDMALVSSRQNSFLRLVDMLSTLIGNRKKVGLVLMDTYSSLGFYYSLALAFASRIFSIPYIPILRGGNLEHRLRRNPTLSALIFQKCRIAVAPSAYMSEVFRRYGYSNIVVIPNSIDLKDYSYTRRTLFRPRLLWVRSLKDIYGPDIALKVLARLRQQFNDACLCLVGPDPDNRIEYYKALASQLGVLDSVSFPGKLKKVDWLKLSSDYDIFLNTSLIDNTPVSMVEAMALGLPIVSTAVGGISYLVQNEVDGLLVQENQAEELALQIERIITCPALGSNLADNARKKVEQYSWAQVKFEWFKLIDSALQ